MPTAKLKQISAIVVVVLITTVILQMKRETITHFIVKTNNEAVEQPLYTVDEKNVGNADRSNFTDNITIVTAYFDIGKFQKGEGTLMYDQQSYQQWAGTFEHLLNPLVVYTDSPMFESLMKKMRVNFSNSTIIERINRNSTWAFKLVEQIKQIYSNKSYPKHHPNTVIPEYSCAQHAKYDVTARAARRNYFRTNYIAWLDVGYFRNRVSTKTSFELVLPNHFNNTRIAMTKVYNVSLSTPPVRIFKQNIVWVGGGLFLGRDDVILAYVEQYRRAVHYFLSKGLMNTDQQVTYGMFSDQGRRNITIGVELQLYHPEPFGSNWFYLGYQMVKQSA